MKKNLIVVLAIFIIPLVTYLMLTISNNPTTAKDVIAGKPQVIKFTSQMCRDCQTMNNIFKEIFPKYGDSIVLTEIQVQENSDYNQSMIKKYNVTLVPTIILLDSKGKTVRRIEGAIPASEMDECLKGLK